MYGAQTAKIYEMLHSRFENDVEMYGAQTFHDNVSTIFMFENDVEMYGAQTVTSRKDAKI